MLSRRDLMGKLAASGAVLVAAGAAGASMAPSNLDTLAESGSGKAAPGHSVGVDSPPVVDAGVPETTRAAAPWELLNPLAMGSAVGYGWRVAGFTGAIDGTCVLTLENERGRAHRIHLCRNAGNPQGLVYTDSFDLLVMNGGQGDLATDESFAQAVAEVAHVLSVNERRQATVVASLLPHDERLRRFSGADRRLR
ncbi:MAG TPA: hypothetical protein VL049_06035 [Candidatus Dormibacteraeota bacterium]|nr:hypothetical protein [Candidatus Dormibacteraeota bacterium]